MSEKLELSFQLQTIKVSEIKGEDGWADGDCELIDTDVFAEMVKGDEKPYFVEFIALYEGVSGNNRDYTRDAVETCVKAMPGVNMYKGHQQPGSEEWQYREPVGQVVAARVSEISVEGQRVLAAKGKAYITDADPKLRSDITKKMAGPLSILGNARAVREHGSLKRTITKIHAPLTSIDFCNPGTNGMALAGVTAVVREMSQKESETPIEEPEEPEMAKLTKEALLAEHADIVNELVGEQMEARVKELAAEKANVADQKQAVIDAKKEHETKIAEIQKENGKLKEDVAELQKKLDEQTAQLQQADLDKFATSAVKEMRSSDDHDEKIVDMATEDLAAQLIDGDIEKSKTTFTALLEKAVEKAEKIAEVSGGTTVEVETKTRSHAGNRKQDDKKTKLFDKIVSPELVGKKDN